MVDRLSPLDASFLYLEDEASPTHVTQVLVFAEPSPDFDTDAIGESIAARLDALPRYRQRIRAIPGRIGNPVWVDDDNFEFDYHVRRVALPAPGTVEQLAEFVARIAARRLDRTRPLWEAYVVEGVTDGRFAVVTKTHQALIDTGQTIDIAGLILDEGAPAPTTAHAWQPQIPPSDLELVASTLAQAVRRPGQVIDTVRGGIGDLRATAGRVTQVGGTLLRASARPAQSAPLSAAPGGARRFVMIDTVLQDYRTVRAGLGDAPYVDDITVNDVALATITGALRTWLQARGEHVRSGMTVRAMVPVTLEDPGSATGTRVRAAFVDLPVGEPSPGMRLRQVSFAMRSELESRQPVGADTLAGLSGFAPPTLHSLGARLGSAMTRRLFSLVITNVPGPQRVLYAGAAPLTATYPVMPLVRGQALAIGMTSYNGRIHYGLYGDRDAVPDLDVLGGAIHDALEELVESGHQETV